MKLLSNIDDYLNPLVVNKVMYAIDSVQVDTRCMQSKNSSYNQCRSTSYSKPVLKTSVLMSGAIQIHREILLSNAKILKEIKIELYYMLQKYDAIVSKSDDIGQTDLIQMHIAMKPDAVPSAAQPYPLTLRHHEFLKQEVKTLLDARIICKSMFSWGSQVQ